MVEPRRIEGTALVVVMAIALLLATQVYILMTWTSGGFRHVEKVNAHMRAIYVGESAFSQIMARLKGAAWEKRWFRDGPVAETDVPILGGSFSSYVATAAAPGPDPDKLVDVWIDARYETAIQVLYYRVRYVNDTLDFTAQVYPQFFTFLADDDPTPLSGPLPPALGLIQNLILQQRNNQDDALALTGTLQGVLDFPGVASILQAPVPGPVYDRSFPVGGAAPVDQPAYLLQAMAPPAGPSMPAAPSLPPAVTPTTDPDDPNQFIEVVRRVFRDRTGVEPAKPMPPELAGLFQDPATAEKDWHRASFSHLEKGFCHWMDSGIGGVLDNLGIRYEAIGDPLDSRAIAIRAILDELLAHLATITQRRVAAGYAPGPAASEVDPAPYDSGGVRDAFRGYREWWCSTGGLNEKNDKKRNSGK